MVKNTKQIALIQHRSGKVSELPKQLNKAELGFAVDTNELFIGNPDNEVLQERLNSNTFPFGNVEILTEFTDLPSVIRYSFSNKNEIVKIPLIIKSYADIISESETVSFIINDTRISSLKNIQSVVDKINAANKSFRAYKENNRLVIVNTDDIRIEGEEFITWANLSEESVEKLSEYADKPEKRQLSKVLDDRYSIKNFLSEEEQKNNSVTRINDTVIALYIQENELNKEIYFPAGEYKIDCSNEPIKLFSNTNLCGEGIGRTILKHTNKRVRDVLFVNVDKNYIREQEVHNIKISNMTIDCSDADARTIFKLNKCSGVTFENVEFLSNNGAIIVVDDSKDIRIEKCIFRTNKSGIYNNVCIKNASSNIENIFIQDCIFSNTYFPAISLMKTTNGIISGNTFRDCVYGSTKTMIECGTETKYVSVVLSSIQEEYLLDDNFKLMSDNENCFCDTTYGSEDKNRYLRYEFYKPVFDYIKGLYTSSGSKALEVIGEIGTNYFKLITEENDLSLIPNATLGNTIYGGTYGGNVIIGRTESGESLDNTFIQFEKNIDINGQTITDNTGDIKIEPKGVISVDETYIQKIGNRPTALATVEYVNNSSISSSRQIYDYDKLIDEAQKIEGDEYSILLEDISEEKYGNTLYLKDASLNIRGTANALIDNISNAEDWQAVMESTTPSVYEEGDYVFANGSRVYECIVEHTVEVETFNEEIEKWEEITDEERIQELIDEGLVDVWSRFIADMLTWYKGNIITDGTDTFVVKETFTSEEGQTLQDFSEQCQKILTSGTTMSEETVELKDVKYVSIVSEDYNVENQEPTKFLFKKNEIDIQKRDTNGFEYNDWEVGKRYLKNDVVKYSNSYYRALEEHTSKSHLELHNDELWELYNKPGFNYEYTFEKEMYIETDEGILLEDTLPIHNFSNHRLYLNLYDKDGNLISVIKDPKDSSKKTISINPNTLIIVTLEYSK